MHRVMKIVRIGHCDPSQDEVICPGQTPWNMSMQVGYQKPDRYRGRRGRDAILHIK